MIFAFVFPVNSAYVIGGWNGNLLNNTEGLSVANLPDPPVPIRHFPLVVVKCTIYMCGGNIDTGRDGTTKACYTLSLGDQNATWTVAPPLPRSLERHTGVPMGLNIWFVSWSTLYDYDTLTGRTIEHAMDFRNAEFHCAVASNGYSYLAGVGDNRDQIWVNTFAGDPSNWTQVEELPIKMHDLSCVLVENELYMQGGYGGSYLKDSFALDINTYKLRRLANMNFQRGYAAAMVLYGMPAVVGGQATSTQFLPSIEVYYNTSNEWTVVPELTLQTARSQFGFIQL